MDVTITIRYDKEKGLWTCDDTTVRKQDDPTVEWVCEDSSLDWEIEFGEDHPLEDKKIHKKVKKSKLKKDAKVKQHKYTVIEPTPGEDPDLIVDD